MRNPLFYITFFTLMFMISVSHFVYADMHTDNNAHEEHAPSMMMMTADEAVTSEDIQADCEIIASAPHEDGTLPAEEEKAEILENCLNSLNHDTNIDMKNNKKENADEK